MPETKVPNPAPGFAKNPGKSIIVTDHQGTVTVTAGGVVFAETRRAKMLAEPPYADVWYIPFADIRFEHLIKTTHASHCPYKGDASYWSVVPAGLQGENAMWAYEHPFDEMDAIGGHGAFYRDRVTISVT